MRKTIEEIIDGSKEKIDMIIKTLIENTSTNGLKGEHGLSLYIETEKHKILFDMGASDLFLENAAKMDVSISQVDLAIISHGHYDHGGGLASFLKNNDKAPIYMNEQAFEKHYSLRPNGETVYIGLDENLSSDKKITLVGDHLSIDEELELFTCMEGKWPVPKGNASLFMEVGDSHSVDDFHHEQNLIVKNKGKTLLVCGCAHRGILNILDRSRQLIGKYPDYVIGGFHLKSRMPEYHYSPQEVREIGEQLMLTGSTFYTCHCTGEEPYALLKDVMGTKISYLATGVCLTFKH